MDSKNIVDLISKDYSWEQVIYQVVAWEGMDPWDVDLVSFASAFLSFIRKVREIDFRVPAKYIIISSVLLRMKSDHLHFLDIIHGQEMALDDDPNGHESGEREKLQINPITMPATRLPKRKVAVADLVDALKSVLRTEEKRNLRGIRRRNQIVINEYDISKKIDEIYSRISSLLSSAKGDRIKFSELAEKRGRKYVADMFISLLHLDNQKRIECSQENLFDEIYIRKR